MKFRVRKSDNFKYASTLAKVLDKVDPETGSLVEFTTQSDTRGDSHAWTDIGVTIGHRFYDSKKFVDAWTLWKQGWTNHMFGNAKFGFSQLGKQPDIKWPAKQCGLRNLLSAAIRVRAVRIGPDDTSREGGGVYHYIVTDYGRELYEAVETMQQAVADYKESLRLAT